MQRPANAGGLAPRAASLYLPLDPALYNLAQSAPAHSTYRVRLLMTIPTEPIGSIPRPLRLLEALETTDSDDPSLEPLRDNIKPGQQVFVGVVSPINPRIETVEEIRDAVLEASKYLPADQLGTTDDCGYSPFCDDNSITRETAFEKIRRRVEGTELAARQIGGN